MFYDPQAVPTPTAKEEEAPHRAILRKAASLIRERGLAKYIQRNTNGSLCLHGAIFVAATGAAQMETNTPFAGNLLLAHMLFDQHMRARKTPHGTPWPIGKANDLRHYANWNNQPERTAEEVIAALEGAADAA